TEQERVLALEQLRDLFGMKRAFVMIVPQRRRHLLPGNLQEQLDVECARRSDAVLEVENDDPAEFLPQLVRQIRSTVAKLVRDRLDIVAPIVEMLIPEQSAQAGEIHWHDSVGPPRVPASIRRRTGPVGAIFNSKGDVDRNTRGARRTTTRTTKSRGPRSPAPRAARGPS